MYQGFEWKFYRTFGANGIIMGPFQHGFIDLAQYSNWWMMINFLKLAIKNFKFFLPHWVSIRFQKASFVWDCHLSGYVPNNYWITEIKLKMVVTLLNGVFCRAYVKMDSNALPIFLFIMSVKKSFLCVLCCEFFVSV